MFSIAWLLKSYKEKQTMKDKTKLIEEITKRLPDATWETLEFVFYYLIS